MSPPSKEVKARYRERHREELRAKGREYAAAKSREAGVPALGSAESTANRRNARKLVGAEHPNWRGDAAGYVAIHGWIARWGDRTGTCAWCSATPKPSGGFRKVATEWHNLSGTYKRDLSDWVELCTGCHRRHHR